MFNTINFGNRKVGAICVALITLAHLVPFAGKAFHIDDPLYIWNALQIHENLFDFYGYSGNWFGYEVPIADVMKNPPLSSYYIALVALVGGWSEVALHLAFLLPALGVALGTYFLAGRLSDRPLLAALAGILTPVFVLCGTSIICDMMMLAFWVWSVFFWVRGSDEGRVGFLFASAVLIAGCAMTRYFGICLIPLLLSYSGFKNRGYGLRDFVMLFPVVVLVGYNALTYSLYGRSLLTDAAVFALEFEIRDGAGLFAQTLIGLAFTGGCAAIALFFMPLLWSQRMLLFFIALFILTIVFLPFLDSNSEISHDTVDGLSWSYRIQFALFSVVGISILLLAAIDFVKRRDPNALLLLLWIAGTLVFTFFINWTLNGRSLLPIVPALGILIARRLSNRWESGRKLAPLILSVPLIASAFLSLLAAYADYRFAGTAREAAIEIRERCDGRVGTIWFQGHWGFQYYMQAAGARPDAWGEDQRNHDIKPDDALVLPLTNTNVDFFDQGRPGFRHVGTVAKIPFKWMSIMTAGAGFYSIQWGSLPFVFGLSPVDEYIVLQKMRPPKKIDHQRR